MSECRWRTGALDPDPPVVTVNIAGTNFPTGGDMQQASIVEGWGELARSRREA
jgi:hypothetical protein